MTLALLADRSACLRSLVLRELLHRPAHDPEVRQLLELRESDPLVSELVAHQNPGGHWRTGDGAWRSHSHPLMLSCMALTRLGYLGFDASFEPVRLGAEFLFSRQRKNGSWALPRVDDYEVEGVTETPLQTALPLRALAASGYATDPRCERGYQWLLERRLDDGAWPTGKTRGDDKRVAGYRRLPHSSVGCRANTTAALQCLVLHPRHRSSEFSERALDHLLGRETRDAAAFGFEVGRLLGATQVRGFISFFARFDAALILDLCARVGATRDDPRVRDLIGFVDSMRGSFDLWNDPSAPQCSRWLSFDVLRSLSKLDDSGNWIPQEPRTPFQPYPNRPRRF